MVYQGKEVLTQDTFSYETARPGDFVEQAVVDDAMNCMPPACMTGRCSQMGTPHSRRLDPQTGHWRATYATFKRRLGILRLLFPWRNGGARQRARILLTYSGGNLCQF